MMTTAPAAPIALPATMSPASRIVTCPVHHGGAARGGELGGERVAGLVWPHVRVVGHASASVVGAGSDHSAP